MLQTKAERVCTCSCRCCRQLPRNRAFQSRSPSGRIGRRRRRSQWLECGKDANESTPPRVVSPVALFALCGWRLASACQVRLSARLSAGAPCMRSTVVSLYCTCLCVRCCCPFVLPWCACCLAEVWFVRAGVRSQRPPLHPPPLLLCQLPPPPLYQILSPLPPPSLRPTRCALPPPVMPEKKVRRGDSAHNAQYTNRSDQQQTNNKQTTSEREGGVSGGRAVALGVERVHWRIDRTERGREGVGGDQR